MRILPAMFRRLLTPAIFCSSILGLCYLVATPNAAIYSYDEPIDAISVGVATNEMDLSVSGKTKNGWSPWYPLEIENEQDPELLESNLITFDAPVSAIRVRGLTETYDLHPLRVSKEPVRFEVAATTTNLNRPRILSRAEWGADDSFLFVNGKPARVDDQETEANGTTVESPSGRAKDCETNVFNYPEEFTIAHTSTKDSQGRTYRWKQDYSPSVKLLVVHHTAQRVDTDERPAVERVRALYAYHANSRGWGDVGYHYLIDEKGEIYEGRAGGDYIVGGHAYCANVGTIGVALLGNFDVEQPPQSQMQALQWLLKDLSGRYKVDLNRQVKFHGTTTDPIVGHGDLLSTDCPGYYVAETLGQVRSNVKQGLVDKAIKFPPPPAGTKPPTNNSTQNIQVSAVGSTNLTGRPGEQTRLSVLVFARNANVPRRSRVATVSRSNSAIGVWQELGGNDVRVRNELILQDSLRRNGTASIRMKLQYPREAGTYTLTIGNIKYTLTVSGRGTSATEQRSSERREIDVIPRTSSSRSSSRSTRSSSASSVSTRSPTIRVRLSYAEPTATITFTDGAAVNGVALSRTSISLRHDADKCVAEQGTRQIAAGVVRIQPKDNIFTVQSWANPLNRFRGTVECRIVDNQLVLINELPLEDYLHGLAEEPDTEPYEKQRAFAIAARTYAAFYIQPANRKFPGMPYDGDDSPARFQKYSGLNYEEKHPNWLKAVNNTANKVLKKDGSIIKPPYFSSNDGRTRSPEEAGWKNFPFAEVFASKPDPWCQGMELRGHGVGMSGCGSEAQANEGKTGEQILEYYYPGTKISSY